MEVSVIYFDSSTITIELSANVYLGEQLSKTATLESTVYIKGQMEVTVQFVISLIQEIHCFYRLRKGFISSIDFASYGTPSGSCNDLSTTFCHIPSSISIVESYCLGQTSCAIPVVNSVFGDPCTGINKKLAVKATYSYHNPSNLKNMPCP